MVDSIDNNWELYDIPSFQILQNRRVFSGLRREFGESIDRWSKRVQKNIKFCKYPTIVMKFLLIDQFVWGLNANELRSVQSVCKSWTLELLLEHFLNENIEDSGHIPEAKSSVDEHVLQIENISLDIVHSEPVC